MTTTLSSGWTGLEIEWGRLHLSHLIIPLGLDGLSVPELLEQIDATHRLVNTHQTSLGLNTPGSFEMIVHDNQDYVTVVYTLHRLPAAQFSLTMAESLMPVLGNNGCGPDSPQDLLNDFHTCLKLASTIQRPVSHGYASLCDLLVFPDGTWLSYSNVVQSSVKLIRNEQDTAS